MDFKIIEEKYRELLRAAWDHKLDEITQMEILDLFNKTNDKRKTHLIDLIKDFTVNETPKTLSEIFRLMFIDDEHNGIYLNAFATIPVNHPNCIPDLVKLFKEEKEGKALNFLTDTVFKMIKRREPEFYDKHLKNIELRLVND